MIPFAVYTAAQTPNERFSIGWTTPKIDAVWGGLVLVQETVYYMGVTISGGSSNFGGCPAY